MHTPPNRQCDPARRALRGARFACAVAAVAWCVAPIGCQAPGAAADEPRVEAVSESALPPPTERLREHYPELQHGPFVCLAHFNDATQPRLTRIVGDAGATTDGRQPALSVLRAIDETGPGGLFVRLRSTAETFRLDGVRSETHDFPEDWSRFHLLLFQTYGPAGGARLRLGLEAGTDDAAARWETVIDVPAGWTQQRIDLVHPANFIDLTRVARLTLSALDPNAAPLEFYLDDILLADNTHTLVTPAEEASEAAPPQLRVVRQGLRWRVGVPGGWDVEFADGVLLRWEVAGVGNLARYPGLGPWFVPLENVREVEQRRGDFIPEAALAPLGALVGRQQELLETDPRRVVVRGGWTFAPPDGAGATVELVWQYTVLPSGAIFVETDHSGGRAPGRASAYVLLADGRATNGVLQPPATPADPPVRWCLLPSDAGAGLLWAPHAPRRFNALAGRDAADGRERQVWLIGSVGAGAPPDAHLLRVVPRSDADQAAALADSYQTPAVLDFALGAAATDIAGDADNDGYNEAAGVYEIAASAGLARFTFHPAGRLYASPHFRVHGLGPGAAWVYVDGRLCEVVWRDAAGALLFTLPRGIERPVALEVLSAAAATPG